MPVRFVDLEGIDQAGKETQSRLLRREFQSQGLKTLALDFPVYSTMIGKEIRAFLEGKRNYNSHTLHMLYSMNRWENQEKIEQALNSADIVMTDRYTASNLAYGRAKGLSLQWLRALDQGLPVPDKVIVLDVPVEKSFSRKHTGRDVHESDRLLLAQVRKNYLSLARTCRWIVVNANQPAKEVHREIMRKMT